MARTARIRILIPALVVCAIVVNALMFGGRLTSWVADTSAPWLSAVSSRVVLVRTFTASLVGRVPTVGRIQELEDENAVIRGALAQLEELQRSLAFYRDAAQLRERLATNPVHAAVFSYGSGGGVRQAAINRGVEDGVAVGDVVVTARGEYVGIVERSFARHALVRMVSDATTKVTARVSGSDVAGLVRSDGKRGLLLDLVQKDETVAEGATLVTSGDDGYPAGMIIGFVRAVENDAPTLFKTVRITPAVGSAVRGDVVVVRP